MLLVLHYIWYILLSFFWCRPMMTSHAGDSSIEDQLRRNRHKIQRNTAATEKNFARK